MAIGMLLIVSAPIGKQNGEIIMKIEDYKKVLIAKSEELRRRQITKDQIAIERNAELLDEIQRTSERELAMDALTRNWQTGTLVTEALDRIANGEYGLCTECEEPIADRRLNAIPWAKYCIKCQEEKDKNASESLEWAQAA